jgi:AbrB family looped-hinge helix DNA binding protein
VPHQLFLWETYEMSDTYVLNQGERGRVVIPAEIRARHNWKQGTELIALETAHGVQLLPRDALLDGLQGSMSGLGTVDEFLAERRHEARSDV